MRCIAHRGFAETNPENTVTAVAQAAERADAVEVDLRRCGSGELVAVHDETVDRVTDATGRVADRDADDLAAMDVLGSGDGIPTVEAVIDAVGDTQVVLDLKEEGIATDAVDAADDAGVDAVVSATHPTVLQVAADAGAADTAYVAADGDREALIQTARAEGCSAIHPHWQLCVEEFVADAHEAGLSVNPWTVPSRHDAEALSAVGVDGLVVDRPAVCLDV